ncbi:MAG: cadherin-like domain-containing protein, partial [Herpetosiphonaceae bacterium]|nr:cadherin-like domain-containing protein [Herpetosiphonaceae bacterium]
MSHVRTKPVRRSTRAQGQRLYKGMLFLVLLSLFTGYLQPAAISAQEQLPAAQNVAAPTPAPADEPLSAAEEPESVDPSAVPLLAAPQSVPVACAAPDFRVFLPFLRHDRNTIVVGNASPITRLCQLVLPPSTPVATVDLLSVVSDPDGDSLSFSLTTPPANGSASIIGSTLTYTPTNTAAVSDTLIYLANDGRSFGTPGTVEITLQPSGNQDPLAQNGAITVDVAATASLDLASLASDPDGDPLAFSLGTPPANGSASLVGSTLSYTPTAATTAMSDSLIYQANDGQGGSASATIQITIVQPSNQAPTAANTVVTIGLTDTVTLDLSALASDPDGDSLTYTLALTPAHGLATLVDSTLTYSPTAAFSQTDSLEYQVSDPTGVSARGTVEFTTRPTRLHITPGSLFMIQQGQTRELSVKAYDAGGVEISTADLGLEWASSNPAQVSIVADSADPARATVTSLVSSGSAVLVVRSRANPRIPTAIATVMVAGLKPGVQLLPDERAVFPEPNPLPNRQSSPYPLDGNGQPIIGGFTIDELLDNYSVTGAYSETTGVSAMTFPVIIRGPAPAVGTLVLVSESAPVLGRVSGSTERGEYTLVQLDRAMLPEAFSHINLSVNMRELIRSGLVDEDNFTSTTPDEQLESLRDGDSPARPNPLAQTCTPTTSMNGIQLNLYQTNMDFDPMLEFDFVIDEASGDLTFWRLITGLKATFSAKSSVSFQAGATLTVSCNIVAPKRWTLPVRGGGWFALINIAIGPRIEVGPKFIAEVKVLGGPKIGLEAGFEASAEVQSGYVWQNGSGQIIKVFNKNFSPIFNKNGIDNDTELLSAQVEFTAGVYMVGIAKFLAGGLIFDTLEEALGEAGAEFTWWQKAIYNKIKRALTFEVLNIKVGPELKIVWGNSAQVLSDKQNVSSGALQLVATGSPGDIGSALSLFGLSIPVEIKLFEETMPFWHLYKPLEAGRNEVKPADIAKEGDTVTFEVYPQGPGLESGEVYYDGEKLTDLTLQGGMLRGQWVLTEAICAASEGSSDGFVKLDVLGYNKMMNQSHGFVSVPPVLRTANYLGQLKLSCAELRIKLYVQPDPTNRPTITACKDKDGKGSLPVSLRAVAEDEAGKMTKVTIDFHGPQKVQENSSTQKKLEVTHNVTLTPDDPTSFSIVAKVYAKGGQGEPDREKETTQPFKVKWVECDGEITEKDTRTRSERCFTITEERSRVGHRKVDADTGATTVEWEPWSPWQESSRTPTGACTRPIRTGGDPHITTQDGLEFDSFSLGEFTYLKPRPGRDGVTVQARQQRLDRSGNTLFFEWTSWTTALAFKADGKVVEIRAGSLTAPLIDGQPTPLAPGLHSFGELDIKVNSAEVVELSYKGNHFIINQVLDFLELRATVPQDNSLYGMLGTPNGEISDDFRWPDGSLARDAFDLANGWRITDRAESLFTYAAGQGPATFNIVQQNEPPSREELLPFVEQARQLLQGACQADVLDEVAVNNTAMELYTGRTPEELARAGLCWYLVRGTVTNELVPGLAVPGAKVTVTSADLDTCETYTDRKGVYTCYMPSLGSIPEVTVAISGRGQGQATTAFTAIPPMSGIEALVQDLAVAPTTLEMTGFVKDGNNTPLYNAELRIKGPANAGFARAFAATGAYGEYKTYMMVDDAVTGGDTTYQLSYNPQWSTEPTAQGINVSLERTLPQLQPLSLNLISETIVLTGNVVKFSGRASYGFNSTYPAPGIRVAITPVQPLEGWVGCDVKTLVLVRIVTNPFEQTSDPLKEGTYSCELPLSQSGAFDVRIQAAGQPAQVINVDPAGRGLGEVIPVVTNIQVTTTVIKLSGLTSDTAGAPVTGTTVLIEGAGNQLLNQKIVVESGPDGRYTAYIGLFSGVTSGNLKVTILYKDIKEELSVPFAGLMNGQLNLLTRDLTVDGRWVRFSGRVINSFAPQVPLDGTITLSAPGIGTLCSATLGFSNVYTCTARLAHSSATALDVSYAVAGSWGSASDTYTIDQLPGLGETRSAPHDVQAQPTTLRLRGTVTSPSGAPLVGATVSAAGPGFAQTKTRADGSYDVYMAIPTTTTSGDLSYTVSFRTSAITATGSFSATPNQVTEVTKDLSYSYRVAYFRGQARNDYGIAMPYSRIVIAAPQLDSLCVTQTATDGSYFCAAQTNATAPFSATYIISGNWGQNSFTELVAVQPGQDRIEHTADLLLNPTALHLVGTLADPAGGPLAGVELTVSGQDVYQEARGTTDASGNYNFYVILKTSGVGQFSGALTYRVGYGTATILRNVPFTASPNALTELYQSFTLNARVIQFSGQITNQHAPGQGVNGSRVAITSPTLGKLCEYSSLNRYNTNTYACDALLFSDEPFAIEYTIEGGWGSARIGGSVASVPELGQRISIKRDLAVSPTTVRLSGQVVDRDGQPIPGAKVSVTGYGMYNQVAVQSDVNGAYSAFATLASGVTTPTLNYLVEVNNDTPIRLEATVVAQPGALTQHGQDFQFSSRKITLSGRVNNLTDPSLPLDGTILIVAPTLGEQLCQTGLSGGAYRCTALIRTDEPFELNYRAQGIWGTTTLINQVVPGGATAFNQDLGAAPRVLHFNGTVKDPANAPLANVKVGISSYSIVQGSLVRRDSITDAAGRYRSSVILGDGSIGGDLSYLV